MKVVWLSANKLGYELLKEAKKINGFDLVGVITLSNRAKTIMYDRVPAGKWHGFDAEIFEVEEINKEKDLIQKLDPELLVMCGWRQLVAAEILSLIKNRVIAFHPTLLPYGRGPAPIINTILKGEHESGLTMFYAGTGLDDGEIIGQERFKVGDNDHADDVYAKVIKAGKKLIIKYLPLLIEGKANSIPQDDSKAVWFDKPGLDGNRIDLGKETLEEAFRKIRALSKPYKGAYIEKEGKRLIIWKAELEEIK